MRCCRDRRGGGRACLAATVALAMTAAAAAAGTAAVAVDNASTPTLCSETDNVDLTLTSPRVDRFTVEAVHPAYAGTIVADRTAPDFRFCDMSGDPVHRAEPREVTLFDSGHLKLVGFAFSSFWRPAAVPVRAGDRVETGLDLLQLHVRSEVGADGRFDGSSGAATAGGGAGTEEVLVLYPPDGYWRARPLSPPQLGFSAYGSSFLIGPVETAGPRPFVDIADVAVDPATATFRLRFVRGGEAVLALTTVDHDHTVLDVRLQGAVVGRPFAALRSMFVTETNADVARVGWLAPGGSEFREAPVMRFGHADAVELWAGRRLPSRHNTSAPDMVFRAFTAAGER